jgi:hypothetical protein
MAMHPILFVEVQHWLCLKEAKNGFTTINCKEPLRVERKVE